MINGVLAGREGERESKEALISPGANEFTRTLHTHPATHPRHETDPLIAGVSRGLDFPLHSRVVLGSCMNLHTLKPTTNSPQPKFAGGSPGFNTAGEGVSGCKSGGGRLLRCWG